MCYNPHYILNKSRLLDLNHDKFGFSVPCGKCGECRSRKQSDFEVRNYYEYVDTIKKGGFVFFDTLTYDQEHVPVNMGFLTFDSKHYKLFMARLRNRLYDYGFDPELNKLKVFFASEYGGVTKRPHYHVLFFVNFNFGFEEIETMATIFNNLVAESWSYGRNDRRWCEPHIDKVTGRLLPPSGILSKCVNAQGAVAYVSKYVTKDLDFDEVLAGQKYSMPDFEDDPDTVPRYKRRTAQEKYTQFMNSVKPFHRQSNGLGECIKDYCNMSDIVNGRIKLVDDDSLELSMMPSSDHPVGVKFVPVPQYIDRKLFYDYNEVDKCFRLKEIEGVEMKLQRNKHNRDYIFDELSLFFNNINSYLTFESRVWLLRNGIDPSKIAYYIDKLMLGRSIEDLSSYIYVYKDRFNTDFDQDVTCDELTSVRDSAYKKYLVTQKRFDDLRKGKLDNYTVISNVIDNLKVKGVSFISSNDLYTFLSSKSFNSLPCFQNFDEIVKIYNVIMKFFCDHKQQEYIQLHKLKSKYKSLYYV